jgi:hypothetical protein
MNFLNSKGFGIVQVLIAAGLAAGVALTMAKMSSNSQKSMKSVQNKTELMNFGGQLTTLLLDKTSCTTTFVGLDVPIGDETIVDEILNKNSSSFVKTDDLILGNSYRVKKLYIERKTSDSPILKIDFEKQKSKSSFGAKNITKSFPLNLSYSGATDKIVSCYSDVSNTIDTAVSEAVEKSCLSLDGATWDSGTQKCTLASVGLEDICSGIVGYKWQSWQKKCVPFNDKKLVMFKLKYYGSSKTFKVHYTQVINSGIESDYGKNMVIESQTRKDGECRFEMRVKFGSSYIDSDGIVSSSITGRHNSGGERRMKTTVSDISGHNILEFTKSDDSSCNNFKDRDIVTFIYTGQEN